MTVKIKDKKLFDKYLKTKQETAIANEDDNIAFVAYCFLSHVSDDNPIKEVQTVVNAIFDGEDVELGEQEYYIELPHIGKENSFLNLDRCDGHAFFGDNINDNFFRTRLTMTEIEKRFPKFKQFAVPVKEN